MVTQRPAHKSGFTLIEMLIVIVIITVLMSLLLVGFNVLKKSSKRQQTQSTLRTIVIGLEGFAVEHGGTPLATEHPLAGSSGKPHDYGDGFRCGGTRSLFVRNDDPGVIVNPDTNDTEFAIRIANPEWVPGAEHRIIKDDDRYQGGTSPGNCELPLLYGLRRDQIGVIAPADRSVSMWYALPEPHGRYREMRGTRAILKGGPAYHGKDADGSLLYQYNQWIYRPAMTVPKDMDPETAYKELWEQTATQLFETLFASVLDELRQSGALHTQTDGALLKEARVRWQEDAQNSELSYWEPGMVKTGKTEWKRYRLRGPALYDAWGQEILLSQAENGSLQPFSAGPDGVFRFHPGEDGVIDTAPNADHPLPDSDDRDGSIDNVRISNRE